MPARVFQLGALTSHSASTSRFSLGFGFDSVATLGAGSRSGCVFVETRPVVTAGAVAPAAGSSVA